MLKPTKKWIPLVLALGLMVTFGLVACTSGLVGNSTQGNNSNTVTNSDNDSGKFSCPFDGAVLQALPKERPIAVVIDNLPRARPQSGLKNADLVFETLAEGGVTRFLAVYYHGQASKVGPIRSARPYFIDLATSVKGVLVHSGGSPDALEYMKNNNGFPHLNEFNYATYFWRSRERKAPHNLYSSTDNLRRLSEKAGFSTEVEINSFSFKTVAAAEGQTDEKVIMSSEIEISFPKGYEVSYTYVPERKLYSRFIAGQAHMDELTNSQLSPRNIIVKFVKTRVIDAQGRLNMELSGHGRALVFSGGSVTEAVWQKDVIDQVSTFKTLDGKSVELLPGQIWIEVVPETTKVIF